MKPSDKIRDQIFKQIDFFRGNLLDALEPQANPENWPLVRRVVLRALGKSGLEGSIAALFSNETAGGTKDDHSFE